MDKSKIDSIKSNLAECIHGNYRHSWKKKIINQALSLISNQQQEIERLKGEGWALDLTKKVKMLVWQDDWDKPVERDVVKTFSNGKCHVVNNHDSNRNIFTLTICTFDNYKPLPKAPEGEG